MMFMSLPTWMLLFGFRYCSAVRSQFDAHNQNDLILETGQQEFAGDKQKKEFPECYDIARPRTQVAAIPTRVALHVIPRSGCSRTCQCIGLVQRT